MSEESPMLSPPCSVPHPPAPGARALPRHPRLTAERRCEPRRTILAQQLTGHALGLAQVAATLVDRLGGCIEGEGVVIQRLPATAGLCIWEAAYGRALLHVDSGGCVLFYQRGAWEQRLLKLVQETR
jgi:hypothetical protein